MKSGNYVRRAGFTLAELLLAVALVAILTATVLTFKQQLRGSRLYVGRVQFSPDSRHLIGVSSDGSVRTWSIEDGRQIASLPPLDMFGYECAISPDVRYVARIVVSPADVPGPKTATLAIHELATGKELSSRVIGSGASGMAFSRDGKQVCVDVSSRTSAPLAIQPIDEQQMPDCILIALSPVAATKKDVLPHSPAFGSDDRDLFSFVTEDELVKWNLESKQVVCNAVMRSGCVGAPSSELVVSPDGKCLAILGWDTNSPPPYSQYRECFVEIFDTDTLKPLNRATIGNEYFHSTAYLDSGKLLAVAGDDLRIFDATTMEVQAKLPLPKNARAMAASPDGKMLAIADWENSIYLYDGKSVRSFVNLTPARLGVLPHFVGLLVVIGVWVAMRGRRNNHAAKKIELPAN